MGYSFAAGTTDGEARGKPLSGFTVATAEAGHGQNRSYVMCHMMNLCII